MDKFYNMVGIDVGDTYEDEYYEDERDEAIREERVRESFMPSRRTSSRQQAQANLSRFEDNKQMKLVIMQPVRFEDARDISDRLKERKPIVMNLESVDKATARRIVDFLSGSVHALDGDIQKVANGIFLIVPCNVGVMNEDDNYEEYMR